MSIDKLECLDEIKMKKDYLIVLKQKIIKLKAEGKYKETIKNCYYYWNYRKFRLYNNRL